MRIRAILARNHVRKDILRIWAIIAGIIQDGILREGRNED